MRKTLKIRHYPLMLLLAFTINAILPFFAVYNLSAEHTKSLTSVFGDKIIICTADGFKWVKLADLQSGKEKPKSHAEIQCPLCYAARHGQKNMAVATASIADYELAPPPAYASYRPLLASFHFASRLRVRAPPVSFA